MSKAYQVVRDFEEAIAEWTGAKYGVAVSSCCNAIFLCLQYCKQKYPTCITNPFIPTRTYPGVPMSIINSGFNIDWSKYAWKGLYKLDPFPIFDCALRFKKDMYLCNSLMCLSFHHQKHLPIGRGGMILTDDKDAYDWLKMARFDGRQEKPLSEDNATICGWNMYMTPEQAARGLVLFDSIKDKDLPDLKVEDQNYPDLSTWEVFKNE